MENIIEMIRGDYKVIPVSVTKEGQPYKLGLGENIMFSVKRHSLNTEYMLQKKLGEGISYNESIGKYVIEIFNKDTAEWQLFSEVAKYPYDIVVILSGNKPKTIKGTLSIERDITRNESITDIPEDTGLTQEQINALNEITINLDDELSIEYDENVLDLDFMVEGVDLVVNNNVDGIEFNINETGELEVNYE